LGQHKADSPSAINVLAKLELVMWPICGGESVGLGQLNAQAAGHSGDLRNARRENVPISHRGWSG
jgi:hypothetical protein